MARTAAVNTLKALILGAPDGLRQALRGLSTPRQAARCRTLRVHASQPVAEQVLRTELRRLATHIGAWDRELRANKAQLRQLVAQVMPVLLDQPGVGPMSADRRSHRGATSPYLGSRGPRRQPRRHAADPAAHGCLALGPQQRRHQDPQVPPHPGTAWTVHRCPGQAADPSGR
jgi:hypothetical protein